MPVIDYSEPDRPPLPEQLRPPLGRAAVLMPPLVALLAWPVLILALGLLGPLLSLLVSTACIGWAMIVSLRVAAWRCAVRADATADISGVPAPAPTYIRVGLTATALFLIQLLCIFGIAAAAMEVVSALGLTFGGP